MTVHTFIMIMQTMSTIVIRFLVLLTSHSDTP